MDSDPGSAGGTSSGLNSAGGTYSRPKIPRIGYLTEPLSLEQLKELWWGGPSEPVEFKGFPDDAYGQMFVYDTTPGSNEGIIAALQKAALQKADLKKPGDAKYQTLLNNLTKELNMLESRAIIEGKHLEDLHWEVIVDKASSDVVLTFVFAKDV